MLTCASLLFPFTKYFRTRKRIGCLFIFSFPQNEDSSTHEKLDFKLHFTCTSYLITTPCYRLVFWCPWSIKCPQRFSLGQPSPTLLSNCIHANLGVFCLSSDAFAKLLESGDLKSSSIRLEGVDMPFHHVLAMICFHHHFSGTQGNLWTSYLKRIILIIKVAFLYFCNVKPKLLPTTLMMICPVPHVLIIAALG